MAESRCSITSFISNQNVGVQVSALLLANPVMIVYFLEPLLSHWQLV